MQCSGVEMDLISEQILFLMASFRTPVNRTRCASHHSNLKIFKQLDSKWHCKVAERNSTGGA